ncbi:hypothetical protein HIM_03458 [Hirsutella minnesotensis 3608]|uniref:Extracellular membrane protein CFEM domain-containing protein n=1 Tax=Hirsutella minnesotensis 3608 TaxID=1043627 RepID=A0A0F8A2N8_9HYPO|nr:hypothetical protein HIM_03458 [Hirsutella minnesotensis 3608]
MKFSTILLAAFVGIASAADTPTPKNDLSCPLMCVRNAIVLSNNAFGATSRALCRIISKDESMDKCLAKCTEYSMSGGGSTRRLHTAIRRWVC